MKKREQYILVLMILTIGVLITAMAVISIEYPEYHLFDAESVAASARPSKTPSTEELLVVSQSDSVVKPSELPPATTSTTTTTSTTLPASQPVVPPMNSDSVTTDVQSVKIISDTANIRSGAGKNYSFVASTKPGETYNVIGCAVADNGVLWFEVEVGDKTGYVSGNMVSFEGRLDGAKAYLTFDDGPSENTVRILDILDQYNAKATFFVIYHSGCESIYRDIVERGHTIALHSYSHDYARIYKSEDAYFNDLEKLADYVKNTTGEEPKIIRFPGGSSNTISAKYSKGIMSRLTQAVTNRGYIYFDWNISSGDAEGNNVKSDKLVRNVRNDLGARVSAVVLMHDTSAKSTTVDALPEIIRVFQERGYSLEALDEGVVPAHHQIYN